MNRARHGALLKIHLEEERKGADEDLGDGVEGGWLEAMPQRYRLPRNLGTRKSPFRSEMRCGCGCALGCAACAMHMHYDLLLLTPQYSVLSL
jgi:hypothetical protein